LSTVCPQRGFNRVRSRFTHPLNEVAVDVERECHRPMSQLIGNHLRMDIRRLEEIGAVPRGRSPRPVRGKDRLCEVTEIREDGSKVTYMRPSEWRTATIER
jgi:hypothetical protein